MELQHYQTLARTQASHWFFCYRRRLISHYIEKYRPSSGACAILDYGAGMGANLPVLCKFGNVTCHDSQPAARDFLEQQWPQCRSTGEPLEALAASNAWQAHFDIILVSYVLYHREVADPQATLSALCSLARPGALLINLEPAFPSLRRHLDTVDHGARRFLQSDLAEAHRCAGWSPLETHYLLPSLFPIAWLLARRDAWRNSAASPSPYQAPVEHRLAQNRLVNGMCSLWVRSVDSFLERLHTPFGVGVVTVSRADQ